MSKCLVVWGKSRYLCSTINYKGYYKSMLKLIDQQMIFLTLSEMAGPREQPKERDLQEIFLDNVSHEIRTPLNAIIGFNDLLNGVTGHHMDEDEKLILKDHIHRNADRLMTMVDDILDLSKMEKGCLTLHKTVVSLMEVCCKARDAVRHEVQPEVKLQHEYPVALKDSYLYTDGKRLEQLLRNLMLNACQHTFAGTITLKVKSYRNPQYGRKMLQIRIDDTGEGIPCDQRDVLFRPFRKTDKSSEGLGIGLAISRQIAKLLGGRVYQDTTYEEGSSFVLEMPMEEV